MKILTISVLLLLIYSHAYSDWSSLGSGVNGQIYALTVYDGELIAGGHFTTAGGVSANYIARWNGSTWAPLDSGMNAEVHALAVYQGELIAGGWFTTAGGVSVNNIAKWNGTSWAPLGNGVNAQVLSMSVYNGELIAGGSSSFAGNVSVGRIAKWNGTSWNDMGGGVGFFPNYAGSEIVQALTVYNNELIAGGWFSTAGGVDARSIAKWNGTAWAPLAGGVDGPVWALTVYNGQLIAGGDFDAANGGYGSGINVNYVASWDGSSWHSLSNGISSFFDVPAVDALAVFNNELIVGGSIIVAGGISAKNIAQWNGYSWSTLGVGVGNLRGYYELYPYINALCVYDGVLIAGGRFTDAGKVNANNITEWNGIVNVDAPSKQVPNEYELSQNYPNPFNPTTQIRFQIAHYGLVTLKIYDVLGREIVTLVNEVMVPGNYKRKFDGSGMASGVYLYKLQTGNFMQTKILLLLK
jgi:hypothetical protein